MRPSASRSPSRVPAPSVVRSAVDSHRCNPANSGNTFSAASAKLSLSDPAKLTTRSAPGVRRLGVKPTVSSQGNSPWPQRPQ